MVEEKKDELCWYYSLVSGEIFQIFESERKNAEKYHIPLVKKPSSSCKKCYGRGYIGKNIKTETYDLCKCMYKIIDFINLHREEIVIETPKMEGGIVFINDAPKLPEIPTTVT